MTGRVVLFLLFASPLSAQADSQTATRRVIIHIASTQQAGCDRSARATLSGGAGHIAAGSPNDNCEIIVSDVPLGIYHLGILGSRSSKFEGAVQLDATTPREVKVEVSLAAAQPTDVKSRPNIVGFADLKVPPGAKKEFARAYGLAEKQDFAGAIRRLDKAIALYPDFAGAYNNLAVAYAQVGDPVHEAEALRRALTIDDHFAPAYLNLGRMYIDVGNFPDAEIALAKASTFDPANSDALILLAYAEFIDRRFDAAIATSRKAHALGKDHAIAHRVAAGAFEGKAEDADAIAELNIFLKEEPHGARADDARKQLAKLKRRTELERLKTVESRPPVSLPVAAATP